MQRTRMPSAFVVVTLVIPFLGGACSVLFTHGPPAGNASMAEFRCTTNPTAPIVDVALATLNMGATISSAAKDGDYDLHESDQTIASGFVWTTILGVSAAIGFEKVGKCAAAKRSLAQRQAQAMGATESAVQKVAVTPAVDTLPVGTRMQLVARAFNGRGGEFISKTFRWSSSNEAVVAVSEFGVVTARTAGTVLIAANADNVVGTASVVVVTAR